MLGLTSLKSWLVVGAALAGLALGTAGTAKFYEWQIVPGRERNAAAHATNIAELRCLAITQAAEKAAAAAALERRRRAVDDALDAHRAAALEQQLKDYAKREKLEQEIADYETQIAELGRQCNLDQFDFDFLRSASRSST